MECTRLYQSENIPKSFKEGYFFETPCIIALQCGSNCQWFKRDP